MIERNEEHHQMFELKFKKNNWKHATIKNSSDHTYEIWGNKT